ncbi:hypothetical protein MES5069_770018 [Mesorhizobium escarrei]|uniref:Uncharacterized protein n=1 Tax=Mesorhizobium escarrei TaxID=666018 RepID=A0ABN8KHA1_9HYPH|nr:hypothetical protein MES5069_770018 [Mesorhizobium escarrei]
MPKNGETGLSTRTTHKAIRQSVSNFWSILSTFKRTRGALFELLRRPKRKRPGVA